MLARASQPAARSCSTLRHTPGRCCGAMASCRAALWATAARPSTLASISSAASTPAATTAHLRRRARYLPRLHAHVYRLQPDAIQAATLYTTQAYQNVLSVLSFDKLGQQLPRWEVLESDAQAGQQGQGSSSWRRQSWSSAPRGALCTRRPSSGPLSSRVGLRPRMVSLEPESAGCIAFGHPGGWQGRRPGASTTRPLTYRGACGCACCEQRPPKQPD